MGFTSESLASGQSLFFVSLVKKKLFPYVLICAGNRLVPDDYNNANVHLLTGNALMYTIAVRTIKQLRVTPQGLFHLLNIAQPIFRSIRGWV